jgi:hypothetical protein
MQQRDEESTLKRILEFSRKVLVAAGIGAGLSLAYWIVASLLRGEWNSPAGAFLLGGAGLFAIAILPFLFDLGRTASLPVRVWRQKKDVRELLEEDRPQSEAGISQTFLFFAAGLVLMLLSFLVGRLFGG